MSKYVVFSIDNVDDIHVLAKFLRHMDTQRAMEKTKGKIKHCISMYDSKLELSFICRKDDYLEHVFPLGFTYGQESVILYDFDSKLTYDCDPSLEGDHIFLGYMGQVKKKKALKSEGFTYRPDIDAYFAVGD